MIMILSMMTMMIHLRIAIGYQTGLAYVVALVIYQGGTFIQTHNISTATIIITLIVIIALLLAIRKILRNQKSNGCSCR